MHIGKERSMKIECATTRAAADVLSVLLGAYLRPGQEFHITDPHPPGSPIHFIVSEPSPAHLVAQVRAIPDTTIVEKDAT